MMQTVAKLTDTMFRPALGVLAAGLLLSVTACGPSEGSQAAQQAEAEQTQDQRDPKQWAAQQFNEEQWGAPGVTQASGGLGPGAGLDFTPENPGLYNIGLVCEGADSMTITVTAAASELETKSVDCGSEVTTTMELPASKVLIAVEGSSEAKGMWAMAVASSKAP
jgi:hypothetical protein